MNKLHNMKAMRHKIKFELFFTILFPNELAWK